MIRVDAIPSGVAWEAAAAPLVVARSANGHDHAVVGDVRRHVPPSEADPLTQYLEIGPGGAVLEHRRAGDGHGPVALAEGSWMVRRQREYTPEGWRRVED